MDRKATIYDVAKKCAVSTATVSRVINNVDYPVSKELRELVLKTAKELDYIPNLLSKALKTKKNKDIGVIVPNISNSYYSLLMQGIYDKAYEEGYNIILCSSYRKPKIEEENIAFLLQKQVSGIIIVSINKDKTYLEQVIRHGIKIVVLEQEIDVECSMVKFNFTKGMYIATKHLIEMGHKKIGFIGAPLDRASRIQMLSGYKQCLAEHNLPIDENLIMLGTIENDEGELYEFKNGKGCAKEFLKLEELPTGYVCINDMTAIGAMNYFKRSGYRVPEDISIVGFDNIPFSEFLEPPLTTIDQCAYKMGWHSVKHIIENIAKDSQEKMTLQFEPDLIIRKSVR